MKSRLSGINFPCFFTALSLPFKRVRSRNCLIHTGNRQVPSLLRTCNRNYRAILDLEMNYEAPFSFTNGAYTFNECVYSGSEVHGSYIQP